VTKRNTVEAAANRPRGGYLRRFGLYGVRQRAEQYKDEKIYSTVAPI